MGTFGVSVAIRVPAGLGKATYAAVAPALRPDDEWLCVWIDEDDDTLVRVSTDIAASGLKPAVEAGLALAQEAVALSGVTATVEEVVADNEDDDHYAVWTA